MIKILERYIARTILIATGIVALAIVGVQFLMLLLGEMKNIGEGDYGILQAIFYAFLRLPNEMYHFAPLLMLLGSVIGLSALSSNRELVVMRASGFSINRIIKSVLFAALLLVVCASVLGELVGPNWSYRAEIRKENAQNAGQAVVTASGVWFHVDNDFIHVKHVVKHQLLEGVTRYEFNDMHQLKAAYAAKTMTLENDQWIMRDVVKTVFSPDRARSEFFPEAVWNVKFNTNLLNVGLVEPNEMTLPKLVKFINYLEENGLQANQYKFEFWQRMLQPFASLIMIFLAIPFVLSVFGTATLGRRILVAMLAGIGFYMLNALLGQVCVVYQVPAFLAAVLPILIFATLGVFLAKKIIKR